MSQHKMPVLQVATALIILLFGFSISLSMSTSATAVSVGTSMMAAGIVLLVQIFFLGDPSQRIEALLRQALLRKLPSGVTKLYLALDDAPRLDQLLTDCKEAKFFGPSGAFLLECAADEAHKRTGTSRIRIEMFLSDKPNEVASNLNAYDPSDGSRWRQALQKAQLMEKRGKLKMEIHYVKAAPSVSALQLDNSYYQITTLFPAIASHRRPTIAMEGVIARGDYFEPLWTHLRWLSHQDDKNKAERMS